METFQIETSQNVQLKFELASLGDRIIARIIDSLIQTGYALVMFFVFSIIASIFVEKNLDEFESTEAIVLAFIMALPLFFYSLIFEVLSDGQTPGKKNRDIKVVSLDGEPVSFGSYFLRWLFRPVDQFFYGVIGIISIVVSDNNQRLGDILAKTTVVKTKKRVNFDDTIRPRSVSSDYQPIFMGAKNLSAKDIELIKKVINTEEYRNNTVMIAQLAEKVRSTIKAGNDYSDLRLLFTVIKDYNYFNA